MAWVSVHDAKDPRAYDGRGYYTPLSLRKQAISVEYICPLEPPAVLKLYRKLLVNKHRLLHDNKYIKPANRRWYSRPHIPAIYKNYAKQISRQLSGLGRIDVVCSGVNRCIQPIAYLECKQPIVKWTDTTYASAIDTNPRYFRNVICRQSIEDILEIEKAALSRCKLAIFSSEWGAQSAIDHYNFDPSRLRVVPFGANLECDRTLDDIKRIVDARPRDTCKLLFVGLEWINKGGDIAYQVVKELNRAGIRAELTVVGCQPVVDEPLPDFVRPLGHIDKTTKNGFERLSAAYAESHFLILPSKAESFGHVFCEASSFGVPSLATHVGGIPTVVKNDLNGRTFSLNAEIQEYCSYISHLFSEYMQYKNLALSSFNEYESRLNWSVAGRAVKSLLEELLS